MNSLKIFSGNSNRQLALDICTELDIPLGDADVFKFSNENIFVQIKEHIRGEDVFVVQSLSTPVNDSIWELLIMIDALKRASAGRITAVIPYYAYGRTDKKDQPRVPITARLLADCLTVAGAHRVVTLDMHAGQIQGFFNIPVDELTAQIIQAEYLKSLGLKDLTIVATDEGYAKKARQLADRVDAGLAVVEKRRIGNSGNTEVLGIIGNVQDRTAIIVDDEIDTGGSISQATKVVQNNGAKGTYLCATHGVFSGAAIDRLNKIQVCEIVVTDSIPTINKTISALKIISVAKLFANAILRIHLGQSVTELFK